MSLKSDDHRVPRVKGRSRQVIHSRAHTLLKSCQPTALERPEVLDVFEFMEHLIDLSLLEEYRVVDSLGHLTEGETLPGGVIEIPVATFSGARRGVPRDRMTIMHECGHVVLHMGELDDAMKRRAGPSLYRREELRPFEDPEWQAFEFAYYALAPTKPLLQVVQSDEGRLFGECAVAEAFGLSNAAAQSRLRSLSKYSSIPI